MGLGLFRLTPAIPMYFARTGEKVEAHFIDQQGSEAEDFWVCFMPDNSVRWIKNSEIRCQENWTLGRGKPVLPVPQYNAGNGQKSMSSSGPSTEKTP